MGSKEINQSFLILEEALIDNARDSVKTDILFRIICLAKLLRIT